MKHEHEYQASKIRPIIQVVARLVKDNPALADNHEYLWAQAVSSLPHIADKSKCGGCGRSMKITIYEADLLDALLVLAMAKEVRKNMQTRGEDGKLPTFTQANRVHIPSLGVTQGISKRQTKADYLCLIKQPPEWKGSGYWVLTAWAWKALRGEQIPRAAKYWEGNLLGRSERQTTLSEMFKTHRDLVERAIAKRKAVKSDHRTEFWDYSPHDWSFTAEEDTFISSEK